MKIIVQRVKEASCEINGKIISKIGKGLLLFIGIEKGDKLKDTNYLARKCVNLRIFENMEKKMNLSVKDVSGEILVISQFTLCSDCKKGLRPSFDNAAPPEEAFILYKKFISSLYSIGAKVKEGMFRKKMLISLVNDGPVTFILSS
ncbi:D-tyrosyl-tRNA(Tyr) deacylase [candidate division WOR-3 bacterium]|nr:D-tyrosyl-tRNA(Tyr) deacylase [candidate division WOR-3 bacterium]